MASGIVIIDKPSGWTSMDVCAKIRGILKEKRVGHGGTLDPMATGVLPVFVGQATRAVEFAENGEKEYIAGLRLGLVTNTQDTSGETLETHPVTVDRAALEAVLPRFTGPIAQIPPMYSAIKINGQKLYDLARKGKEVERKPRNITIFELELLEQVSETDYLLRCRCSKGTYLRTLCHDIGQALGCGGTMFSLRRTMAAEYTLAEAVSLEDVQAQGEALLRPVESMFTAYPLYTLPSPGKEARVRNGNPITVPELADGTYRVHGKNGEFLCLSRAENGTLTSIKNFLEHKTMSIQPKVIALGFFDGVHLGHGALLRRTVEEARRRSVRSAVFTWAQPPKEVVTGVPVPLINSPEDRAWLAKSLYGIDDVIMVPFNKEMMTTSWEDFITEILIKRYHAVHLVAGHDHRFGHKNQGTPELLKSKCAELGLGCDIIPEVTVGGITVSSTYIRRLVSLGQVERAMEYLGHPHILTQTVRHGRRIGHTIGIPTVNLVPPPHVLVPGDGVYIARVCLMDGSSYAAVTNVGTRPTVNNGSDLTVESWMLDFDGDLYGQSIRVEFYKRLRDEIRFDSLDALKAEIRRNADDARAYFASKA